MESDVALNWNFSFSLTENLKFEPKHSIPFLNKRRPRGLSIKRGDFLERPPFSMARPPLFLEKSGGIRKCPQWVIFVFLFGSERPEGPA